MKNINNGLKDLLSTLKEADDFEFKAQRSAAVYVMWKNAVEAVYKDLSQLILGHINAVYVMKADEVKKSRSPVNISQKATVLVVYCDDSMVRSDLDARQEFLKIKFNEQGERVEGFTILPSQFDMKKRHPYAVRPEDNYLISMQSNKINLEKIDISSQEQEFIETSVSSIENNKLRESLKNAMIADFKRKQN